MGCGRNRGMLVSEGREGDQPPRLKWPKAILPDSAAALDAASRTWKWAKEYQIHHVGAVGSIVVACHLLDQVNYGAPKTCLDLHECLDERQAIGGGKEVGDIGEEKRVGRFL